MVLIPISLLQYVVPVLSKLSVGADNLDLIRRIQFQSTENMPSADQYATLGIDEPTSMVIVMLMPLVYRLYTDCRLL
jgi:hypothetical protein